MTRKNLAVNLIVLALSVGAAAWARSDEEPEVLVRLIDAGSIPPPLLIQAKDIATKILASAGVRLRWTKIGRPLETSGCASGGAVEIVDLRFTYSTPATYKPRALAEAHPFARSGVRITVFFDRLTDPLKLYQLSGGAILGHVLAHEIGHVLLRVAVHGDGGLMKAWYTDRDYSVMALRSLRFSAGEAKSIQAGLASRCNQLAVYSSVHRLEQIHDHLPDGPQHWEPHDLD